MVFGKDQDASKAGKIGNIHRNQKYGDNFTQLWKDSAWRKKKSEMSRKSQKEIWKNKTKEEIRLFSKKGGENSRRREKIVAEKIKPLFDNFFEPSRVCDRVGFKDGKLIFIEIKKDNNDKLRPLQKQFQELCKALKINYEIHYYNKMS